MVGGDPYVGDGDGAGVDPLPEQRVDVVVERAFSLITNVGLSFFFNADAMAVEHRLGLRPRSLYLLGRGGMLGDVSAGVVRSMFGFYKPTFLSSWWEESTRILAASEAARLSWDLCAEHGRHRLAAVDHLDDLVNALGFATATANSTGMTLFAAVRDRPGAPDPPARTMQLIYALRELRTSAMLMAIRSVGLDDVHAHYVLAPHNAEVLGWANSEMQPVTDNDRELVMAAMRLSDEIVAPAFADLDEAARNAVLTGLETVARATAVE